VFINSAFSLVETLLNLASNLIGMTATGWLADESIATWQTMLESTSQALRARGLA
jgi:hypothetical protein